MIEVEELKESVPTKLKVEMVERKGKGHPDSLADGIAEAVSRALCREYLKRFGTLMHHNTDQGEVIGGEVKITWDSSEIIRPIHIILSGRATDRVGDEIVPIHEIAVKAAKNYLEETLPNLDVSTGVIVESRLGRGSEDLVNVFKRERVPLANDTSFGVGFAPYTPLENLVLKTEEFINSPSFKKKFPYVGEDVKVMGLRIGERVKLTIAAAMIVRHFSNASEYLACKEEVKREVEEYVKSISSFDAVEVYLNTADNEKGKDTSDFYLTISGTSAEMGDDGSVGRGNRASGLITPCRPMSMEACAGKNPYNHVGKLYNVLAFKIARRISEETDASNVIVKILSQIGKPITEPKMLSVQMDGSEYDRARKIAEEEINNVTSLTMEIIEGKHRLF
jgi:S-adenosylmethionine synthetase